MIASHSSTMPTSSNHKEDSRVPFDGKLVISTNLRIGSTPHLNAVKDRFHIFNIEVTFLEKLAKIQDLALNPQGFLAQRISLDGNKEILAFLLEHQRRIGDDRLSLRMFSKVQELYVAMPDGWREDVEDSLFSRC